MTDLQYTLNDNFVASLGVRQMRVAQALADTFDTSDQVFVFETIHGHSIRIERRPEQLVRGDNDRPLRLDAEDLAYLAGPVSKGIRWIEFHVGRLDIGLVREEDIPDVDMMAAEETEQSLDILLGEAASAIETLAETAHSSGMGMAAVTDLVKRIRAAVSVSAQEAKGAPEMQQGREVDVGGDEIQIASRIRRALVVLSEQLRAVAAEGRDDAVAALRVADEIDTDLAANFDIFDPGKVTVERRRLSVSQGEAILKYDDPESGPWQDFGDDIRSFPNGLPKDVDPRNAIGGYAGRSNRSWLAVAENWFYGTNSLRLQGIAPVRTRDTAALVAQLESVLAQVGQLVRPDISDAYTLLPNDEKGPASVQFAYGEAIIEGYLSGRPFRAPYADVCTVSGMLEAALYWADRGPVFLSREQRNQMETARGTLSKAISEVRVLGVSFDAATMDSPEDDGAEMAL